ncbi:flippase [Chloroflexota bacterium]
MSTIRSIAKNTIALIFSQVISVTFGFFFVMYVARYLGAEGFGTLSFALAFTAIFSVFTDVGLSLLIIREVARDKSLSGKYLANVGALKIALSVITFGLVALIINLLNYPEQIVSIVYIIAISTIFNSFNIMFYAIFQAFERMEFVAIGQILSNSLQLVGALYAINMDLSITAFTLVYLIASSITLGYNTLLSTWKFTKLRIEIDHNFWIESLKQAWPFGLVVALSTVSYWADSVMLSLMKGYEIVGWYNAAYRVIMVVLFIPSAYLNSVFPVMSRLYVSSKETLTIVYEKSTKYMVTLAVPIGVGITILADRIIVMIFGNDYSNSAIALQILVWSAVSIFISALLVRLFNSLDRQVVVAKVTGSGALLNVILNLIVIPKYGYVGAGTVTVATEFIILSIFFTLSFRVGYGIPARKLIGILIKVLIASTVMGVFVFSLRDLTLFALVPISALLYFIALFMIGGIDREDINIFRKVIGKRE